MRPSGPAGGAITGDWAVTSCISAVVVVGLGIAASSLFQQETQQTLRRGGDALQFGGYDLQYTGYEAAIATDGRQLDIAELSVSRAGEAVATLQPRLDYFRTRR